MIFQAIGITPPALYHKLVQNKVMSFFVIMFLVGSIHGQIASSGAFEVYLNGDIIFSKLKTGRMPSLPEIENALKAYNL